MEKVTVDVQLSATRQGLDPDAVGTLACPACGRPMSAHQPDGGSPHRLLASCARERCGAWYVVVLRPREQIAHVVRMPSEAELVAAIERRREGANPAFPRDGQEPGPG